MRIIIKKKMFKLFESCGTNMIRLCISNTHFQYGTAEYQNFVLVTKEQ